MIFESSSPEETRDFAAKIASKSKAGDVIALSGELGAGKTSFVQGLALGLGVKKEYYVNSPTFTLLNIYEGGRIPLYHLDWYRITSESEGADLGLEEYFDGDGVSVIEWAEKFPNLLPKRTVWIKIEVIDKDKRRITTR